MSDIDIELNFIKPKGIPIITDLIKLSWIWGKSIWTFPWKIQWPNKSYWEESYNSRNESKSNRTESNDNPMTTRW